MANKKQTLERQVRNWLLWRRSGTDKTLMFALTVSIEEDPQQRGWYSATVDEMPGSIIAVEKSQLSAEAEVLHSFREVVDHCLSQGQDKLDAFINDASSAIMAKVDLSFDEVSKQVRVALKQIEKLDQDSKPWISSLAEAA